MIPGPNVILKIRASGMLVKIQTIRSGNTCGARFWTDGKCEAPMLPDSPWLRRHPMTGELFWTSDCEKIGEASREQPYQEVPFAKEPRLKQYVQALASGMATNKEKEQYIRTRYWWAANDPVRNRKPMAGSEDFFRENLTRLRTLLDNNDPDQRVMAAEIARELGNFAEAAALLDFQFPKEYARVIAFQKRLVEEAEPRVKELSLNRHTR